LQILFLFSNIIISESSLFQVSFGMKMFDVKMSWQLWSDPCAFESLFMEVQMEELATLKRVSETMQTVRSNTVI
jgi:hypothetical protein